jgi:hypothetical protein
MIAALSPLSASPLLCAGLQKIAHTMTGRLYVGYHVVPRCGCNRRLTRACGPRPFGASLNLDRILAGGTTGEQLPLSIERSIDTRPLLIRAIDFTARQTLGGALDVTI